MADRERPDPAHVRPDGVSDATVEAVGKLSEALETVEQARGHLYGFHQLMGRADRQVGEAAELLRAAGHEALAERVRRELVGRNVAEGRWTFQLVEEFDDGYWSELRALDADVRDALVAGRRHLYESESKEARRTRGRSGHESRPGREG
ncbi:MAG: hypothetical protein GXY65_02740 [Rhodococcus sp.]|uniref:hypothetical protein n=1 Tax=Rhodococcus TaxID=1827 RepID=UPI0016ADFB15|nr:hypothetical protein [Rhodococcus sp. (in: high G+C Gram-positive bacteria)]NLV78259.1 hypothetical protein [Rhodococcus sp. (in: high G+C Gram-positive bacteria)]